MGTPDFAVGILDKLIEANAPVVGVITAPDKPAGRGRRLHESAVKKYAVAKGLPVLQPTNLKAESFLDELRALKANLQIVVAFRMLPKVVWAMPEHGTFNLHASLLPEYRGAAPINWAVINGESESGVTTFFIDEKIDTGAIITSEKITLEVRETAGSLHDKLMELGGEVVVRTTQLIADRKAHPQPQPKDLEFKEAPKLNTLNTQIDWKQPGARLDAMIRGLSPYPTAWTVLINQGTEQKVKIQEAIFQAAEHGQFTGQITAGKKELAVAVSDGYLYIKVMQLPGKRKMDIVSLLNGYNFEKEAKFA